MRRHAPLALALILHLALQVAPAWSVIRAAPNGRDFASYYYALQVARQGGDPYDKAALTALAQQERTRRSEVHPYFYPPPFLLAVGWAAPLSLGAAYRLSLLWNELLLAGVCALSWRYGASLGWLALILVAYSPVPDNAWMGQANLLALLPALAGLWLSRARRTEIPGGLLIGLAGMLKMSPALFLIALARWGRWRAVAAAVVTAVALSLIALPLVPLDTQWRFYTQILPGFSSGDYNGLSVPITLNANHSVPDLLHRWLPSGGDTLSPAARRLSQAALIGALAGWWAWFRSPAPEAAAPEAAAPAPAAPADPLPELLAIGALSAWMVCLPVYTYEHHLVFLIPALAALCTAAARLGRRPLVAALLLLAVLALPLEWSRVVQKGATDLHPWLGILVRESKFFGEIGLIAGCMAAYRRLTPAAPIPAPPPQR